MSTAAKVQIADVETRQRPERAEPVRPAEPSIARAPTLAEPHIEKWAAWKVSLFVILFCGAFWSGVIYLGMRLFGH